MRKIPSLFAILAGALLWVGTGNISAQDQSPGTSQFTVQSQADLKTLNLLLGDIQAQQKTIADNQTLIDQRLATLAETIRVARLFSKRGGGAPK